MSAVGVNNIVLAVVTDHQSMLKPGVNRTGGRGSALCERPKIN